MSHLSRCPLLVLWSLGAGLSGRSIPASTFSPSSSFVSLNCLVSDSCSIEIWYLSFANLLSFEAASEWGVVTNFAVVLQLSLPLGEDLKLKGFRDRWDPVDPGVLLRFRLDLLLPESEMDWHLFYTSFTH